MRHARRNWLLMLLVLCTTAIVPGAAQSPVATVNEGATCPVTFQPGVLDDPPMGWGAYEYAYGDETLRVTLKSGGSLVAPRALVNERGEIWDKFLFWAPEPSDAPLVVTGRRLDAEAPPLRADGQPAGTWGGLATMIYFPTTGCWEVTGQRGEDSVTFVLLVARAYEFPVGPGTPISNIGPIAGCDVTLPNASVPPGHEPSTRWHGNGQIWTQLPVDGVIAVASEQMSYDRQVILESWPWVGDDPDQPVMVSARLLRTPDGEPAASTGTFHVRARADAHGVDMLFSSAGCWEITGSTPVSELNVTVLILPPE